MNSSLYTRWITILLLICLPLQGYAAGVGNLCLCQNTSESHGVFQHLPSPSESSHHHANTDHPSSHFPMETMNDDGGCGLCGLCLCCGILTSTFPPLPKLENSVLISLAIHFYQFILEPPQHPPRFSHV